MTLIKFYKPELSFHTFNKVFDQMLAKENQLKEEERFFIPQIDIAETDKNFTLRLAVPGIKKEDISIELNEDTLTVSGERKTLETDVSVTYHKQQTAYGKFKKSFSLPENIDKESILAKQEDGILSVVIQKIEKKENKLVVEVK